MMVNKTTHHNDVSSISTDRKEQGATRENILRLLRRHGQMTAIELSETLNIGAVGVRQHLALLERDGLVEVSGLRRSVGRPSHLYALTAEAEHYFPKAYDQFALDLLNHMAEQYGEEAVNQVLRARNQQFLATYAPRLAGKGRKEQLQELVALLNEQGHMCEFEQLEDGSFILMEYNCPIDCVARNHRQVCAQGHLLYQELLGVSIRRLATIADGDIACRYHIPA